MSSFRNLILILIGFWAWAEVLSQEVEKRAFAFVNGSESDIDGLYFLDPEGVEVELKVRGLRRSQKYIGDVEERFLPIYRKRLNEKGVLVPEPVFRVDFRTKAPRALVFLDETGGAVPHFDHYVVDATQESLPSGSLRFLNLTGAELNCEVGSRQMVLGHGLSQTIIDSESSKPLPIALWVQYNGKWEPVYRKLRGVGHLGPMLFLVRPPDSYNSLEVRVNVY